MAVAIAIEIDGFSDSITVRRLTGAEEMSRCYYYDVTVEMNVASSIDFSPIGKLATLTFSNDGANPFNLNSKVAESVQITDPALPSDKSRFRLHLVPDLWFMGLGGKTKIYINKTYTDIISDQFDSYGIKYELSSMDGTLFSARPLVSQYKESSLNFVSRLLEDKGVYYYFRHKDTDTLIISNSQQDYGDLIEIDQHAEIEPGTWTRFTRTTPTKVRLTGYDFRKPSYDIFGEAESGDGPFYEVHVDDEVVKDQDEATQLAQIRLEQHRVYSDYITFRSFNYFLSPGSQFKKDGKDYVVTQVSHSHVHEDTQKSGDLNHYRNSVLAIRSEVIFRPEIITKIPYAEGTEIAHVYSETSSEEAMIDEEGLYTVRLNYVSDKKTEPPLGKLRMQQPASGEHDGLYFPLKNETEVLIAFTKGNPDLPYIDGSMSCGKNQSHVKGGRDQNPHHSIIKARHMLVLKSFGGMHTLSKTSEYDLNKQEYALDGKDDHAFLKLDLNGVSTGEMTDLEEHSGEYHIERRYGHKYSFVNGNNYNWDNSSTFNFGNDYVENHEKTESADNSFDLTTAMGKHASQWEEKKNGLVKKTWGDVVEYYNGRSIVWGEMDGGPHESYSYGSRYQEKQVDIHGDRIAGGPGWEGQSGFVEKTEGDTYMYHNGNAEIVTEGSITIQRNGNISETLEGDTEFKRTGKFKSTHDGDVETDFMSNIKYTTHGNLDESTDGKVTSLVQGKIQQTYSGGRETTEHAATTHTYKAALTIKQFSLDEKTDSNKTETVQGVHKTECAISEEKVKSMKTLEAPMLQTKGNMATIKHSLIMLG